MKESGLKLKRRGFLKLAAGTGIALGAGLSIPRFVEADGNEYFEAAEKEVFTRCGVCSAGCSMKGYVKYGRLVHLEGNPYDFPAGNPYDPSEGGRICVKAHNAIRTLYDPDRLKYPMKRTNPKKGIDEDPGFEKISWEEAIEIAAEKLNTVIQENGPESLAVFSRSHAFLHRLGKAIGTPNFLAHQSTCFTTQMAAWAGMVMGSGRPWTYDMENCRYILGFGFDGLGKAKRPHMGNMTKALSKGAKMVIVDPYQSITAARAHKWISIKPGTDLAFSLAMIHVIINENLYNRDFVEEYTEGFEELRAHVNRENYTPEWAAELTDVDADTIRTVAREFAAPENQPAHIFSHKRDAAGPNYSNSYRLAQAQVTLNALVGTIDRPGGTTFPRNPSFPGFDSVFPLKDGLSFPEGTNKRIDNWEEKSPFVGGIHGNFATVHHGILNQDPYPLKGAIVRQYNPMSFPDHTKMVEAFASLDFLLCFEIYPSEMAWLADIVLPESHWLETSGVFSKSYHSFYPMVGVRLPTVDQVHEETKGSSGIIVDLAKAMGYGDFLLDTSEGGSGYVSGGKWNDKRMRALGSSWEELANSPTGLWEPADPADREFKPREEFGTPSGKIEFYSTLFEENGYDPLPRWQPRREEPSDEYPFNFLISRPPMHKMTQTQNNPLALEVYPENTATMNVATGEKLGVRDGDEVYVESRAGKIKLKAKLIKGIREDCVMVYHGFGHYSKDLTKAFGRGANDGDLIPSISFDEMKALNDPGMGSCMCDFGVNVYKA